MSKADLEKAFNTLSKHGIDITELKTQSIVDDIKKQLEAIPANLVIPDEYDEEARVMLDQLNRVRSKKRERLSSYANEAESELEAVKIEKAAKQESKV